MTGYGSALDADFDALIVSEETLPAAIEINKIRREKGRKKVDIHQISCVLAEDGRWISRPVSTVVRLMSTGISCSDLLLHLPCPGGVRSERLVFNEVTRQHFISKITLTILNWFGLCKEEEHFLKYFLQKTHSPL